MCSFQMLLWARSLQSGIRIIVNDSSWPHLPAKSKMMRFAEYTGMLVSWAEEGRAPKETKL